MVSVDWNPDETKLRQFGYIAIAGFGILGWVVNHHWKQETASYIIWGLAVICPILSLTAPKLLKPIFVGLMAIAMVIGFVISHVPLGVLFYLVFTPLALWFKLIRRDVLRRAIDKEAKSYWIDRGDPRPAKDYYRQF